MASLLHYLFSFEGRISRTKWWLGQFVMIGLVLGWVIHSSGMMGSSIFSFAPTTFSSKSESSPLRGTQMIAGEDPIAAMEEFGNKQFVAIGPKIVSTDEIANSPDHGNSFWIGFLVLAWPYCWIWLAVTAKRLHDTGKSGWWGVPAFAPTMFYGLVFILSNGFTDLYLVIRLGPLLVLAQIAQSLGGFFIFSTCGFQRGSPEANPYGPPIYASSRKSEGLEKTKSFDREDVAIQAAIARMASPPLAPVAAFATAPQKPVFGRRG